MHRELRDRDRERDRELRERRAGLRGAGRACGAARYLRERDCRERGHVPGGALRCVRERVRGVRRAGRSLTLRRSLLLPLFLLLPLPLQAQQGHLVIISGLSGESRFARDYLAWGTALVEAAQPRFGIAESNVVWLAERADAHARIRDRSTRENVERELRALAQRAAADDRVLIVLFGHGSFQGGESRINLPGPDIDGKELARLLDAVRAQVAVVNTTSSSGGFIQDLAAPNRIVITATRTGMESNETLFGRHFTAALTTDAADTDQDGRVSLLEAFEYARLETDREYARTNRLKTEHAMLDGVGDGRGVAEASGTGPHVAAARGFHLRPTTVAADASPELRALHAEKARIEAAIEALRARRSSMQEAEYEAELEKLLVELSRNAQAIRRMEGARQ